MDIYIMGNKIDYTIENEKTVKDVIESISEIVNGYGHSITELRVDGKIFQIDDPMLEKIEISEVNNLEIETASFFEISSSLVYSLIPYLKTFKKHLEENNIDFPTFEQAKSWITEVLLTSINILFQSDKKSEILSKRNDIVRYFSKFSYKDLEDKNKRLELISKIDQTLDMINEIVKVLDKISEEGNIFFDTTIDNNISELLRLIDDIPLKLQLGKDKEALEEIYEFSETFIDIVDFLNSAINIYTSEDIKSKIDFSKFDTINKVIESIIESISNKDYVLASDIMTYELKPLVEDLRDIITIIREKIYSQISEN